MICWQNIEAATKNQVFKLLGSIHTLRFVITHPKSHFAAKLTAFCAVGYLISPIQAIPSFIPVIGQLDDVIVLVIAMKLLRRVTTAEVLKECEERSRASIGDLEERRRSFVAPSTEVQP